jgi:hypothetical protein
MSLLGLCAPGKKSWRPRHGQALEPKPQRSRYEKWAHFILERVAKKVLLYPMVALVIATFLAFAGHAETVIRSSGVLLVAAWLMVDLWIVLFGWNAPSEFLVLWQKLRHVIGWGVTSYLLIGVMVVMQWLRANQLEDQQVDVWNRIELEHDPSGEGDGDPRFENFTIVNRSSSEISKKHGIICDLNEAFTSDGSLRLTGPLFTTQDENGNIAMGDPRVFVHQEADAKIGPGGDVETEKCLASWKFEKPMASGCMDATILFWYALEDQPDKLRGKSFRLAAVLDERGHYQWSKQNGGSTHSICNDYRHKMEQRDKQQ